MKNPSRFLFLEALLTLLIVTALVALTVDRVKYHTEQDRKFCQAQIRSRDANRNMWIYVIGLLDAQGSDLTVDFRDQLDHNLPILVCVNNVATPGGDTNE